MNQTNIVVGHQRGAVVMMWCCNPKRLKHQEEGTRETGGTPGAQKTVGEDVGDEDISEPCGDWSTRS